MLGVPEKAHGRTALKREKTIRCRPTTIRTQGAATPRQAMTMGSERGKPSLGLSTIVSEGRWLIAHRDLRLG